MANTKSKYAFKFTMQTLAEKVKMKDVFLWTFTFREALDVTEAKARWSKFLKHPQRGLVPSFPQMSGIRVFEMHPGVEGRSHGLHIHAVVDCFLPVDIVRLKWNSFAGDHSRIHVKAITKDAAHYIGKYLNKKRDECLGNARLWAAFGKCESSKVRDIVVTSEFTATYAFMKSAIRGFTDLTWPTRMMLCNRFMNGASIDGAFAAAGMKDDYWEQCRQEQEYFKSLSDAEKEKMRFGGFDDSPDSDEEED